MGNEKVQWKTQRKCRISQSRLGQVKVFKQGKHQDDGVKGNRARAGGAQDLSRQYLIGAVTGCVIPSTPYFSVRNTHYSANHNTQVSIQALIFPLSPLVNLLYWLYSVGLVTNLVSSVLFCAVFESVLVFIVISSNSQYSRCSNDLVKLSSRLTSSINAGPRTTVVCSVDQTKYLSRFKIDCTTILYVVLGEHTNNITFDEIRGENGQGYTSYKHMRTQANLTPTDPYVCI